MGEVMNEYAAFDVALGFNRFQTQAMRFASYEPRAAIMYPALGLAGETGEVCEKIKKVYRDKGGVFSEDDKIAIGRELGDVLWYISAVANDLGLNLGVVATGAIRKLEDRATRGVIHGNGDNR